MIEYEYEKAGNLDEAFGKLYAILEMLRSPEGCPWDRNETAQSVLGNLKSEIFEVLDEIAKDDEEGIVEETGDVLLNSVMLLVVLKDAMGIDPERVIDAVCRKLISRHPHVFSADVKAESGAEALEVWNSVKRKEGKSESQDDFFSRIPESRGTYERAEEVLSKAIGAGFVWDSDESALEQAASEVEEVRAELGREARDEIALKMEIGDMILSAMSFCEFERFDPEDCLRMSLRKFEKRFNAMRSFAAKDGISIRRGSAEPLAILDKYWRMAKRAIDEASCAPTGASSRRGGDGATEG